jgi:hypothetical protein
MVFRLSFAAADARVRAIAEQAGGGGSDGATASPIPAPIAAGRPT